MYPFARMIKELIKYSEPMPLLGVHTSTHICWPWDLDMWLELNNGRALTLYDLGRMPLARRTPLGRALLRNRWSMTMAGSVVRYRRRIRVFDRIVMKSRAIGWDDKFIYLEQSMWKSDGECASHVVYRGAITDKNGIVAPDKVMKDMQATVEQPQLPDWVNAWCEAETLRPWPPMQD